MPNVVLFVTGTYHLSSLNGHFLNLVRVIKEKLHHFMKCVSIARGNYPAIPTLDDDFITTVYVSYNCGERHCTCLHHDIGESLSIAGKNKRVGSLKVWTNVVLESYEADVRGGFEKLFVVIGEGVEFCLEISNENELAVRMSALQTSHTGCELVHSLVGNDSADEDEYEICFYKV